MLGLSGGVAFGIGGVIMPTVAQLMIDAFGWRGAYTGLGALVIGKRGLTTAGYAASFAGCGGCQFQGMSSSQRAAGQSAAILAMTSAI